jgi:alpha-D-xyloside xylohydrolase
MLGKNLLVAPIFNEEGTATYYLPKGKWMNFFDGEVVEGGTYYEGKYDYFNLPLYVKPNSILPLSGNTEEVVYDYTEDITLNVSYLEDGKVAKCIINNVDTSIGLELSIERTGSTYIIHTIASSKPFKVLFRTLKDIEVVEDIVVEKTENGVMLYMNKSNKEFIIIEK